MNNANDNFEHFAPTTPGATAAGVGSPGQLVDGTGRTVAALGTTASPTRLVVWVPQSQVAFALEPQASPLEAAEYPVLAELWGNDEDDVFDRI